MKVIGRSYGTFNDAGYSEGYIVQLNTNELHQLGTLVRVLSGKADNDLLASNREFDLTQALKAITAFAEIKYSVNELQGILKKLDESLMPNEPHV